MTTTTTVSPTRTTEQIRAEITALEAELSTLAGTPLLIWDGMSGDLHDVPIGGALLHVSWAVSDRSYQEWYPGVEQAKAALLALARANDCVPSLDGFHVDLTSPGCHSSSAYIERRAKPQVIAQRSAWNGKAGDEVILLPNHHLCGGPATGGTWRENGLRNPNPDEKPTHKVIELRKKNDIITGNDFTYVTLEVI